jgi:hypothetical protein
MASIRIAAIALALCACTVLAQQPTVGILSVLVKDQSGAVIPGAHIVATVLTTGTRIEVTANGNGQAVVHLDQGSYDLKVWARGFETWKDIEVEVNAETYRAVTLIAPDVHREVWVTSDVIEIPQEHPVLAAEISSIPMQQYVPPAKPFRHKRRWF